MPSHRTRDVPELSSIHPTETLAQEDNAPDLGASMYADMLGAALSEVDWFEIADNVLEEETA